MLSIVRSIYLQIVICYSLDKNRLARFSICFFIWECRACGECGAKREDGGKGALGMTLPQVKGITASTFILTRAYSNLRTTRLTSALIFPFLRLVEVGISIICDNRTDGSNDAQCACCTMLCCFVLCVLGTAASPADACYPNCHLHWVKSR